MPPHASIEELRDSLNLARAEEAEALRRAHRIRAVGTAAEFQQALREVDVRHQQVVAVQRRLAWQAQPAT